MYLCISEEQIACVFYYAVEEDEDYREINGKWLNEKPYAVVHRVASTGIVKGAASYCLDWVYTQFLIFEWTRIKTIFPCKNYWKNVDFNVVVHLNAWEQTNGWHIIKNKKKT